MIHKIHDYVRKLSRPEILPEIVAGVSGWESTAGASIAEALRPSLAEVGGPLSINLDLTVACNYHCTHCIDLEMLNSRHRYQLDEVLGSLAMLRLAGLRSVILIGGGEPTLHAHFRDTVWAIKALGLQCAIVSNGSNTAVLASVAPLLNAGDWIRLSLDAGTDATFQAMHNPRGKPITLESICAGASAVKQANHAVSLGFSYLVSWNGAVVQGRQILDNIHEMALAARLAKEHQFDYISFKPVLTRDDGGAETIVLSSGSGGPSPAERIREQLAAARALEGSGFRVVESLNLSALRNDERLAEARVQPRTCRMHLFRQVLTAVGVFGCPVYRDNPKDRLGEASAYRTVEDFLVTRRRTYEVMTGFDASHECRNVACLYNETNWWLEDLARGNNAPEVIEGAADECFL